MNWWWLLLPAGWGVFAWIIWAWCAAAGRADRMREELNNGNR